MSSPPRSRRNHAIRSELKTITKRLHDLLSAQKLDEARVALQDLASRYDHAASAGAIHRNTASRHKSRLMGQLNKAK